AIAGGVRCDDQRFVPVDVGYPAHSSRTHDEHGRRVCVSLGQRRNRDGSADGGGRRVGRERVDEVGATLGRPGRRNGEILAGHNRKNSPGFAWVAYADCPRPSSSRLADELHVAAAVYGVVGGSVRGQLSARVFNGPALYKSGRIESPVRLGGETAAS